MHEKLKVAIVGTGFGKRFIPVYLAHPEAELVTVCARHADHAADVASEYGIPKHSDDYRKILDDPEIDAVHIITPCEDHAWMSIAALQAGKHTACTVPVGMTLAEIQAVVDAQRASGKTYMMMETAIYTREYLYIRQLRDSGTLGRIQFVRGSHLQDMSLAGWSAFWNGLPPMWYATHCLAPCLDIASGGGLAETVACRGSGRIRTDYVPAYGSPFSFETAHVKIRDTDVYAEVSRFVHGVTRQYCETLDVYGSAASVEWRRRSEDDLFLFDGGEDARLVAPPDAADGLPGAIAGFARQQNHDGHTTHASFIQGGSHGGSYPHLVHEFLSAIRNGRKPAIDIVKAANWSATGLCAHESAMAGGREIAIPDYGSIG